MIEDNTISVVAVGDSGTIVTSHNAGKNWFVTGVGGGTLSSIARSDRTMQVFVVGDKGRLLVSDDAGDTWNSTNSGTSSDLSVVLPLARGEKLYAFGQQGTFERFTPFYPRYTLGPLKVSHVLARGTVQLDISGLRAVPAPTFTVKAVRTHEMDRTTPVEIPAEVGPTEPGTNLRNVSFDLGQLNPHAGEAFELELCLHQGAYSRCIPLPRMTAVPWLDFAKNKNWLVPLLSICAITLLLETLLFLQPLWILSVYRRAYVYDFLEKTSIPGAAIIKFLLQGTLVPWFAFHHRTLAAWTAAHRLAFLNQWGKDLSRTSATTIDRSYVPLPVEVRSAFFSKLLAEPSQRSVAFLFEQGSITEIVGPGGIGKTTLLMQIAKWMLEPSASLASNSRAAIAISVFSGRMDEYLKRKIDSIVGEDTNLEFIRRLLKIGVIVPFIDGYSELSPEFQGILRDNLESLVVRTAIMSSRNTVDVPSMARIQLIPMPLDSRTLLHFITSLLSDLPDNVHVLNTMELQLELGHKIAAVMNTAARDIPLTPLLVKLYVDRAVDLLTRGQSLDELPSSIAQAYFDFIHLLIRQESPSNQAAMLASIKALARLSLGDRLIPAKFSFDSASRAIRPIVGDNAITIIKSLIFAGILNEEDVGLGTAVQFALDPLAEFCAAYSYVEEIAFDTAKWRSFVDNLRAVTSINAGFRLALGLVLKECVSKGICSPLAVTLAAEIANDSERDGFGE